MIRLGWVVKDGKWDIKNSKQRERSMDVPLIDATLRVERDVTDTFQGFNFPFGVRIGCTDKQ